MKNNGHENDAWDVFQEGLIVLLKYCRKVDFMLNVPLSKFFSAICWKLWLKTLKKNGKSGITFSNIPEYKDIENQIALQEEDLITAQRLQMLWKHLERLPQKEKQTLKLYYMEGKSHREIAEIMGFSNESSAKVQKFKYIKRLRAMVLADPEND